MNCRVIYSLMGAIGLSVGPPGLRAQQHAPIAIVVNPSTEISDISFTRLRKIFLGEEQFWEGKQRITLLVRAPVAREREVVLKQIYDMSEAQFRQYWIAKLFRAEVSAGPKIVYSTDMAKQLVIALPGAVAFLPAAEVGTNVRILKIDGKLPGEPGYKLQ
jgi:hypothetical protein